MSDADFLAKIKERHNESIPYTQGRIPAADTWMQQASTDIGQLLILHEHMRKALGRAISAYLGVLLDQTLDDGTPVLVEVFRRNPGLRDQLIKALERESGA